MGLLTDFVELVEGWSVAAVFWRLFFAMVIGLLIGIDRGMKNRGAGIKTHVLVCIGSALVMITSQYIQVHFSEVQSDVSRLGAQVISGVGFLGVGTIIVTGKRQVRGLTTAAGLWASACCGLAIGIGFVTGALLALAFIMFTLKALNVLDLQIHKRAKVYDLYIEFESNKGVRQFTAQMRNKNVKISNFELTKSQIKGDGPSAVLCVDVGRQMEREDLMDTIRELEYVNYVEEL